MYLYDKILNLNFSCNLFSHKIDNKTPITIIKNYNDASHLCSCQVILFVHSFIYM